MIPKTDLPHLLSEVRACRHCEAESPMGAHPVLVADERARILVAGQAPARSAYRSGIPWNDVSRPHLKDWRERADTEFDDPAKVAFISMGFCYPGKRGGGNAPK